MRYICEYCEQVWDEDQLDGELICPQCFEQVKKYKDDDDDYDDQYDDEEDDDEDDYDDQYDDDYDDYPVKKRKRKYDDDYDDDYDY